MEKRVKGPDGREYCTTACCGGPPAKQPAPEGTTLTVPSIEDKVSPLLDIQLLKAKMLTPGIFGRKDASTVAPMQRSFFWSRRPGNYVDRLTGQSAMKKVVQRVTVSEMEVPGSNPKTFVLVQQEEEREVPITSFEGTVKDWYEKLGEEVLQCANEIFRKCLVPANLVEMSPDLVNLFEAIGFDPGKWRQVGANELLATNKLFGRYAVVRCNNLPANELHVKLISEIFYTFGNLSGPVPEIDMELLTKPATLADYKVTVLDMPLL
jgi:hypothetical protein